MKEIIYLQFYMQKKGERRDVIIIRNAGKNFFLKKSSVTPRRT